MEQFSYFAYGSYEPFMGIYNPHTDSGVVHWADAKQVPAKKIFVWSLNSDGLMWRDRLSDNHSTYLEMQSGLFQDQASFGLS